LYKNEERGNMGGKARGKKIVTGQAGVKWEEYILKWGENVEKQRVALDL
jgi:hypothetical protein